MATNHVGFKVADGTTLSEPDVNLETALTLQVTVDRDLEPQWTLVSPRAQAAGKARNLNWTDRVRLAPTRLGEMSGIHLGWRRGSVLNRISGERADVTKTLAEAVRTARRPSPLRNPKDSRKPCRSLPIPPRHWVFRSEIQSTHLSTPGPCPYRAAGWRFTMTGAYRCGRWACIGEQTCRWCRWGQTHYRVLGVESPRMGRARRDPRSSIRAFAPARDRRLHRRRAR